MKRLLYISDKPRDVELKHFFAYFQSQGVEVKALSLIDYVYNENAIEDQANAFNPEAVLIHHNRFIINHGFWQRIVQNRFSMWWVNDERFPIPQWIKEAMYIKTFFVASEDTAKAIKANNQYAEYLIMGINPKDKAEQPRCCNLTFTGQNLNTFFPLSQFRKTIIEGLKHRIGDEFYIYGKGWDNAELESIESGIYQNSLIGLNVNHYNTEGTYSNRVLQIMVNGAVCLMHNGNGLAKIFGDNAVYFNDVKEAFRKYNELVNNIPYCIELGEKGRKFVNEHLTWESKAKHIYAYASRFV